MIFASYRLCYLLNTYFSLILMFSVDTSRFLPTKKWQRYSVLLASIIALASAFTMLLPDTSQHLKQRVLHKPRLVTQPIPLQAKLFTGPKNHFWRVDQVTEGDTLESLFKRLAINDAQASEFMGTSEAAITMSKALIPGRTIKAYTQDDGHLMWLKYPLDDSNELEIKRTANGFEANTQTITLTRSIEAKSAVINNSLFVATDAADVPDTIALQMAEVFSSDIDFREDLREGDQFYVLYESFLHEGKRMYTGKILAIEFINQGKVYQAIHYGDDTSKYAYFTPDGKSLHKTFLRTPLEFTRVSSSFDTGRFHPILQRIRAHKGVDLAAPSGTRIMSPGDGVVKFVGQKGGYGNVIELTHANQVMTVYGHLSAFAKGLKAGLKVAQGDLIGFVGMTGLATGPHLHYEFLLNGVHRDPMTVALPKQVLWDAKQKAEFAHLSQSYLEQIRLLKSSHYLAAKE